MTPLLAASGSGGTLDEHQVLVFLMQLALLVGAARLLGGIADKLRQPPVVGQILAGVLIGPSVLGKLYPGVFDWLFSDSTAGSVVYGVAWLAVIMLLVVIGYETDLGIIMRFRRAAVNVSAGGLLVPLAVVGVVALLTPSSFIGDAGRGLYAAFMALALSVAALPVVAKILAGLGMLRRNFGQVTLAVSMTMDSVGWLILAGLAGIARDGFRVSDLLASLGGLVLFLALAATVGRWALDQAMRLALRRGRNLPAALTVSLVAAIGGGAVTQALGLEAILGAFIVGIILATLRYQVRAVRHVLETVTDSFFAPVFFAFSGLRVDIALLASPSAIIWTVVLIVIAVAAKVAGAYVGARRSGLSSGEGLALGSGLSALGAMGIVVALVGLSLGVLSDTGYTVIVVAAIVTSLIAPIMLRVAVRGMEAGEEEQSRLESEAIRSQAQILGSKRILLPTRGGANSVYAAHQLKALFPEAEVTVLTVADQPTGWRKRLLGDDGEEDAGPGEVMRTLGPDRCRLIRRRRADPAAGLRHGGAGRHRVHRHQPAVLVGNRPGARQAGTAHPHLPLSRSRQPRRPTRPRIPHRANGAAVGRVQPGLPRRRRGGILPGRAQRRVCPRAAPDREDPRREPPSRSVEQQPEPPGRPGAGGGVGVVRRTAGGEGQRRGQGGHPARGSAGRHRQHRRPGSPGDGSYEPAAQQAALPRIRHVARDKACHHPDGDGGDPGSGVPVRVRRPSE